MSDYDRQPTNVNVTPASSPGGGLYFIVGGLVVAALVGAYFVFGMPGDRSNIATTPDNKTSITIEQPRAPATPPAATPATPAAPAAPAAPRQ